MSSCPLRKCQGKRGCLCPTKPPPFIYSKTTQKEPSVQKQIPIIPTTEVRRQPPKYIGEKAPPSAPPTRIKNNPKKTPPKIKAPVKAITAKVPRSAGNDNNTSTATEGMIEISESRNNDDSEVKNTDMTESKGVDGRAQEETSNGEVQINYNHYKKKFTIVNGSVSSEVIDNEYCLTFAYPKCKIHLSTYGPNDFSYEDKGLKSPALENENPSGVYQNLRTDTVYWVHLEEDAEELEAYKQRQEKYAEESALKRREAEENEAKGLVKSSHAESCSCIEGNPCMDRYGCKNWDKRYEVAKQNGWKGKYTDILYICNMIAVCIYRLPSNVVYLFIAGF